MEQQTVSYDGPDRIGIARITMDRGQRGNALNAGMVDELFEAFVCAARDDARVVVLQGMGKHFCTGFDLTDLESESPDAVCLRFIRLELLMQFVCRAPYMTIGYAPGRALGGGADLLMCCDFRVIEDNSLISFPGLQFGVILGAGRLHRRVSDQHAVRLLAEGREFGSCESMSTGLTTHLVDGSTAFEKLVQEVASSGRADAYHIARARVLSDSLDRDLSLLVQSVSSPKFFENLVEYKSRKIG